MQTLVWPPKEPLRLTQRLVTLRSRSDTYRACRRSISWREMTVTALPTSFASTAVRLAETTRSGREIGPGASCALTLAAKNAVTKGPKRRMFLWCVMDNRLLPRRRRSIRLRESRKCQRVGETGPRSGIGTRLDLSIARSEERRVGKEWRASG